MESILFLGGTVVCVALFLWLHFGSGKLRTAVSFDGGIHEADLRPWEPLIYRLSRKDALWSLLCTAVTAASQYMILSVYAARQDLNLWSVAIFDNYILPHSLTALLVYLLSKIMLGHTYTAVMAAIMLAFAPVVGSEYLIINRIGSVFLAGSLLCLYLWFSCEGNTAWEALVLSAVILGFGTYYVPGLVFCAIAWFITLLCGEALRLNRKDSGPLHLILTLFVGVFAFVFSAALLQVPLYLEQKGAQLPQDFLSPRYLDFFRVRLSTLWEDHLWDVKRNLLAPAFLVFFSIFPGFNGTAIRREPLSLFLFLWFCGTFVVALVSPLNLSAPLYSLMLTYVLRYCLQHHSPGTTYALGLLPFLAVLGCSLVLLSI